VLATPLPATTDAAQPDKQPTQRPLTGRERTFVSLVAQGYSGGDAYLKAFKCSEASAYAGASRLRQRSEIRSAIEAAAKQRLQDMLPKAVNRLDSLMYSESDKTSLDAVKATLDRTGVPAVRSDQRGAGGGLSVSINIVGHSGPAPSVVITQDD